ncbi:uncharacterized protein CBL_05666 [Carabus blaptoides fortunei]
MVKSESSKEELETIVLPKATVKATSVFSLVNAYTYKYEKIYDHASDSIKDENSVQFSAVFDKDFYTRTVCNIRDNLLHHMDGKLNRNIESESRISNFEHNPTSTCVTEPDAKTANDALDNFGCDLSLNAVTPVATLLSSSQYGEDFDSQIEYGAIASQKKPKKVAVVKYKFTNKKYNSLFHTKDKHTDLTYLDMWTQLTVKKRQHKCHVDGSFDSDSPFASEFPMGYEAKEQVKELNRILDKRGPFEDLRKEADAAQFLELRKKSKDNGDSTSEESSKDVYFILEDLVTDVVRKCNEKFVNECDTKENRTLNDVLAGLNLGKSSDILPVAEAKVQELNQTMDIPNYLQLQPSSSQTARVQIDKTDKIAMICSAQDDAEMQDNKLVELSGEWARPRIYICATCGLKLPNLKSLDDHKNANHPQIWCSHYEFVGNQSQIYRHLSIPGLGKVGVVETLPATRIWQKSDARVCSKCSKQCQHLGELHKHMLECGGDWTWMLARKKCKYRPYGARTRRRRQRGYKRSCNVDVARTPREPKIKPAFIGPRPKPTKPSDAETIERMLANLPPKRNRKVISMRDGIQRPRKPYKQKLVSQSTSSSPDDTLPNATSKKVHFKTNSPQISTKQTLRNALKRKISVQNLRKQNNSTENLDISLKLRSSRVNNKPQMNENTNVSDTGGVAAGKKKMRNKRMISRILGSKIFDSNSALLTRRRLVKAITQNSLMRKTRLRSKILETNGTKDEEFFDELANKSGSKNRKAQESGRKGRGSTRFQSNNEESNSKSIKSVESNVKHSEPVMKSQKKSTGKRLISMLTKSNKKPKSSTEETKSMEEGPDTINSVMNEVVAKKGDDDSLVSKKVLRKTRSTNSLNKVDAADEQDDLKNDDLEESNDKPDGPRKENEERKSDKLGQRICRRTSKLVRSFRKTFTKTSPSQAGDKAECLSSKLMRTLSLRGSKSKKVMKNKERNNTPDQTELRSTLENESRRIKDEDITRTNTKSDEIISCDDSVMVKNSESDIDVMPTLEKIDPVPSSEIPVPTSIANIPVLSPVSTNPSTQPETIPPKLNITSDTGSDNLKQSDNKEHSSIANGLLTKLKNKVKKPGRGLNDCIAMLKCKLEQQQPTQDESALDKSNLFILNSCEVVKHNAVTVEKKLVSILPDSEETKEEMMGIVPQDETITNNAVEAENIDVKSTDTVSFVNDEQTVVCTANVLEIPTIKNLNNSINKESSSSEVFTVETQTMTVTEIPLNQNTEYIPTNIQLSYVLNATLKNCLMECVKSKCEKLKIENENVALRDSKRNCVSKTRKIGSIRKRKPRTQSPKVIGKSSEIYKPIEIPNIPIVLNNAFLEKPISNKVHLDATNPSVKVDSSDEDIPLSKFVNQSSPVSRLKIKLPVEKKRGRPKKKIAFTPHVLNDQDKSVLQVDQTVVDSVDNRSEIAEDSNSQNQIIIHHSDQSIPLVQDANVTETSNKEYSTVNEDIIIHNHISEIDSQELLSTQDKQECTPVIDEKVEQNQTSDNDICQESISYTDNISSSNEVSLTNDVLSKVTSKLDGDIENNEEIVIVTNEKIESLSQYVMSVEDEPCESYLINKTLTEANIEPSVPVRTSFQNFPSPDSREFVNKASHVDSGKENTEEKSFYPKIKKNKKSVKKSKNKRRAKTKIAVAQIENSDTFTEFSATLTTTVPSLTETTCTISDDQTLKIHGTEYLMNNFKCHLQTYTETEPEYIGLESKDIHESASGSTHLNITIDEIQNKSPVSSDSEDEVPLAALIKNRKSESMDSESSTEFNELNSENTHTENDVPNNVYDDVNNEDGISIKTNLIPVNEHYEKDSSVLNNIVNNLDTYEDENNSNAHLNLSETNIANSNQFSNVNTSAIEDDIIQVNFTINKDSTDSFKDDPQKIELEQENPSTVEECKIIEAVNTICLHNNIEDISEKDIGQEIIPSSQHLTSLEDCMKTPEQLVRSGEEMLDFMKTPVDKLITGTESDFITTPDLADTTLVIKIQKNLKLRKSKKGRRRVIPKSYNKHSGKRKEEEGPTSVVCDICNKTFKRKESLASHKRTLTHIAKLSEIEARESFAKRAMENNEMEKTSVPEDTPQEDMIESMVIQKEDIEQDNIDREEITDNLQADENVDKEACKDDTECLLIEENEDTQLKIIEIEDSVEIINEITDLNVTENDTEILEEVGNLHIVEDSLDHVNGNCVSNEEDLQSADVISCLESEKPTGNLLPGIIVNSANTNLKLVDIINEVLDKPVNDLNIRESAYISPHLMGSPQNYDAPEPKRYKSLGERKSFDSDNFAMPPKCNEEPPSPPPPPPPTETFNNAIRPVNNGLLSKQISLLENIIEETNPNLNYIDDSMSLSSSQFEEPLIDQTIPQKHLFTATEYSKMEDPQIKFSHNADLISSFIKPNNHFAHFENITEPYPKPVNHYDEISQPQFEEEEVKKTTKENATRKILNRDEELFLECCSLLKSGSEISGVSKKSTKHIPLNNFSHSSDANWIQQKPLMEARYIQRDSYSWLAQGSRVTTPIGEPFVNNDWSNSNSAVSSEWLAQKAPSPDRPIENKTLIKKSNNNSGEIKYSEIQFEDISVDESIENSKTLMAVENLNTQNVPLDFHHVDFSNNTLNQISDNQEQQSIEDDKYEDDLVIDLNEDSASGSVHGDIVEKKDECIEEQKIEDDVSSKGEFDAELKKKVVNAFGGLMAKALTNRLHAVVTKSKKSRAKRDFENTFQASITEYTVPLKKSKVNNTDSDSNECPKKLITKGAMKIFEGLKVSIPTQDLNLKEVLYCSSKAKKLEDTNSEPCTNNDKLDVINNLVVPLEVQQHKNGKLKKLFNRFGNKLGMRETKKKQSKHRSSTKMKNQINSEKSHDVYDFEESLDNNHMFNNGTFPLFRTSRDTALDTYVHETDDKEGKATNEELLDLTKWPGESESDDDRYYDSMSFEEVSLSSESTTVNNRMKPTRKKNAEKSKDNQKKCMIMGRIFKNASKPKLEDKIPEIRDISSEENSKIVGNFPDSCSSIDNGDHIVEYQVLPPVPNNLTVINSANKMSKIEMDLLFDKLLESERKIEAGLCEPVYVEPESTIAPVEIQQLPTSSPLPAVAVVNNVEEKVKKPKEIKTKPPAKNKKRQRHHSNGSTSSDEFTLRGHHSKSSKKHHKTQKRATKPKKDGGINLEQEMKECIGVAGRKSQRKCTSGKQNVLVEFWSSDESSLEEEIFQLPGTVEPVSELNVDEEGKKLEDISCLHKIEALDNSNSVNNTDYVEIPKEATVEEIPKTNVDVYEFISDLETKSNEPQNKPEVEEFIGVGKIKIPKKNTKTKARRSRKHSKADENGEDIEYGKNRRRNEHSRKRMLENGGVDSNVECLAVTRKKRNAGEMLYYWSSSSDDEFQDLIEVKPIREDTDDDRPMHHGWIVGDSPKKLVTMLAQAKGKKIDGESVKEQGKKNRVTL